MMRDQHIEETTDVGELAEKERPLTRTEDTPCAMPNLEVRLLSSSEAYTKDGLASISITVSLTRGICDMQDLQWDQSSSSLPAFLIDVA